MWHNDKVIQHLYTHSAAQQVFAIFDGVTGWKRVRTGAADGVSNVGQLLTTAKLHGRKVNVYLDGDQIERVVMR